MKLKITIDMDYAAFDSPSEVGRILHGVADGIDERNIQPGESILLTDTYGNTVGEAKVVK